MKTTLQRWFGSPSPAAVQETTKAMAQRGVVEAQFSLGLRFASGQGAAPDYAQAEHWYLKAASQNHALAHFNLGMMHARGQGMPSDKEKSQVWIQKAAELGDASAQYNLGLLHHRTVGDGTRDTASQSRIEAYKWLHLAALQGYWGAEAACNVVRLHMTHEDVQEGGRQVASFNSRETNAPEA
jgi:TPR repeat protein